MIVKLDNTSPGAKDYDSIFCFFYIRVKEGDFAILLNT